MPYSRSIMRTAQARADRADKADAAHRAGEAYARKLRGQRGQFKQGAYGRREGMWGNAHLHGSSEHSHEGGPVSHNHD